MVCFAVTLASQTNLLQLYTSKLFSGEWGQKQYLHIHGNTVIASSAFTAWYIRFLDYIYQLFKAGNKDNHNNNFYTGGESSDLLDYLIDNLESKPDELKIGSFDGYQYHVPKLLTM